MANKINTVFLQGNLVKDPDYREFNDGSGICSFRVASGRTYKNNGKDVEEVTYADTRVYGKLARTCRQFLSQGSHVLIEGRLHLNTWEAKDGQQRQRLEIVAENIQFLSSRKESQNAVPSPPADHPNGRRRTVSQEYAPSVSDTQEYPQDDDMPF